MKTWMRAAAAVATAATLAALTVGASVPATAQSAHPEIRLQSTGNVVAYLHVAGGQLGPLPTNTEHPYGWSGQGIFTMQGAGSCQIIVDGAVVASSPGPVAGCRYP